MQPLSGALPWDSYASPVVTADSSLGKPPAGLTGKLEFNGKLCVCVCVRTQVFGVCVHTLCYWNFGEIMLLCADLQCSILPIGPVCGSVNTFFSLCS